MSAPSFVVGLSAGFRRSDGSDVFPDFDLSPLTNDPAVEIRRLTTSGRIDARDVAGMDALILLGDAFDAESVPSNRRLKLVARFGVGFDKVDLPACNAAGIFVSITPDAVRRPVAVAILTLILALSGRLFEKDRLTRLGAAGFAQRGAIMGVGLAGKVLGSIGLGNIAGEMFRLARPLDMRFIANDPFADQRHAEAFGVTLVPLDELFEQSDVLTVNCPALPATLGLVSRDRLRRMKTGAYLINTARGTIVDQAALVEALNQGWIAGAGLDVLEPEPPSQDDPILTAKNVILTPHALSWTDQSFAAIGRSCVDSVQAVRANGVPEHLANPDIAGL